MTTMSTFRINQPPGVPYATWDRSRRGLALGGLEFEAQQKALTTYLWEVVSQPPGSALVLTGGTTHTCSCTIAIRGGYRIKLTVDAWLPGESVTIKYFGIPFEHLGVECPAANETTEDDSMPPFDGSTAWADKFYALMLATDGLVLAPAAHGASHVDGTDDIQTATALQKGVMSAAAMAKLDTIEANADVTDAANVAAAGAEMAANKNAANGYAGLSGGKLAGTQLPYGALANTACQGNDARLSDGRTDANALHTTGSGEINALTETTAPAATDLLVVESAGAAYAKRKVQVSNLARTAWGARTYVVGTQPGMYGTIAAALAAVNANPPGAGDRALVFLMPGYYAMTSTLTVPAWTKISGSGKDVTQLYNATTDLFTVGGSNVWFENFLIEGAANSGIYAFQCADYSAIHVRNVDMLHNGGTSRQGFLRQVGSTWTILFIENCIVDWYGLQGYLVLLQNNSGAARIVDVQIRGVFFDTYHLTNYGGSFLLRALKDVRFDDCIMRGINTYTTCIRHELHGASGTAEFQVAHCRLEAGAAGVPIYGTTGTNIIAVNTDCENSTTDGTSTVRNGSAIP